MGTYVIGLVHEEDRTYGICFPDFPGCVSAGATFDETVERGRATLAFHVEGMVEDGDPLPSIRTGNRGQSRFPRRATKKTPISDHDLFS